MGRIMALDYGRKRTGIAVSDPLQLIAGGLATVRSCDLLDFVTDYVSRENVERIVIGQPKQMNGQPSENMKYITPFVKRLKEKVSVPVEFFDERFTSVLAHKTMLEGGLKKTDRQNKALVDEISAVIILQSYMESKKGFI